MNFWHNLLGSFLQWYLMITVVALLIVSQTTFVCPAGLHIFHSRFRQLYQILKIEQKSHLRTWNWLAAA